MTKLEEIAALMNDLDAEIAENVSGDMTFWRDRIDVLDQILLVLLNERSVCANEIGHIKKEQHLPIYVPEREKIVLENVLKGNEGPLDDGAVRRLFERIIDETRALERRKYQSSDPRGSAK